MAVLNLMQRKKRARTMKRLAHKLRRIRKMKLKRMASKENIEKRANKAAIQAIRKKVAGKRGEDYKSLEASQKMSIDKLVEKKKDLIKRMAKRLLPKIRAKERERLKKARENKDS